MITLGVDIGTTRTKALALDVDAGRVLGRESAPTPVFRHAEGHQRDASEVLAVVVHLLRKLVVALPGRDDVAALCVASVGEEAVLVDAAGSPTGDTIAWFDPRGSEEAAAFTAGEGGRLPLSRRWPPDPSFSLFKLLWLRDHRERELGAAAGWTDLGDFVLHRLGGELVMDWSHASRAGAFDIVEHAWDRASIEAARLTIAYPRLVPSGSIIGSLRPTVARDMGLPHEVALVSGGHDHLCAAYGAGVRSSAELFLSAGTSEAHLALLDSPPSGGSAMEGVDVGCYVDDRTWYAHINIHSGHFFRQWRALLYPGVDDEQLYAELEAASSEGVTFDVTADLRRGRLDAVPYDADRATLMRAVLEGSARRSAAIVDRLEEVSDVTFEVVLAAGLPARVPLWRALRRAAYRRPMSCVEEAEPTAFGAAVLAARSIADIDHIVADRSPPIAAPDGR